ANLVAQSGTPDIQVSSGTTTINLNDTVDFGTTPVGVASSKAFTVTNTGTADLLVSEAVTVPQGFTLMATISRSGLAGDAAIIATARPPPHLPALKTPAGKTATFTVALNSATAGNFSGSVSFQTNVTGKLTFAFNVTGKVLPPPSVRYIDDNDAGFTF